MWILLRSNPDGEEYCVGRIIRGVQLKWKSDGEEYGGKLKYPLKGPTMNTA